MMNAVGIDIGGTKISLVLGTEKGKVLLRDEIPTRTGPQARRCVQELTARLKLLLRQSGVSRKKILGIGIGCPGAVNSVKGTVPRSPNLPGWTGIPLRKILSRSAGLPVFLANDANAAAMGESLFGAGCGVRDFIYITVSTGVGGGIVLGGRLHEGAGFAAGEIGHMSVVPDGQKCNCGKRGCLEVYASGTAIARFYRVGRTSKNTMIKKFLSKGQQISARQVGMAACEGDKLAIESYKQAGYYLGIGIANLLNLLNPQKVILGGGVLRSAHKIFWLTMASSVKKHAWPEAFHTVKIVRSKLDRESGTLGALALVFKNYREDNSSFPPRWI